ncbi:hypothetical protein [Facklamia miroungae]|uniref:Two-component signal transduction system YycFG, regulatory protein YycH n=1 Tax=Facklamia miroungae TaxID=120956 RepID=A0A1G7S1U3_9LACT|nr:hypothetical protein [Facklamia miroungae]NKZ29192.1 hypothetical protein [Facklamia miroungae]SDG17005.1 Two-component signal transduction system YycFG, regulatory protein YycH [Facklamia miroungae]
MKKRFWISVCLVLAIFINIVFSYFLINNQAFKTLYQKYSDFPKSDMQIGEVTIDQPYFQTHQLDLAGIVAPYQLIIKEAGKYYHAYQSQVIQEIHELTDQTILELTNNQPQIDPIKLDEIMSKNHIQFIYLTKLSLSLLEDMVEIPEGLSTQFKVNRIILPKDQTGRVYFVDSINKSFLEGRINPSINNKKLFSAIESGSQDRIEMLEYDINRDTVYLPKESLASPSQVYSLEKVPENNFIDPVFEGANFDITQPDLNNVRSYHTYNSSLMIDDDTNIMTVTHHNNQNNLRLRNEEDLVTQRDLLLKSLELSERFNYWGKDIRVFSDHNNQLIFRRFLAGMPIFSDPTLPDYGASKLNFVSQYNQLKLEKLQMPLIVLGVNITDLSSPQLVESGAEIKELLEEQNLKFSKFNQIILGFEWQKDMENFKKVNLVPKWFFVVGTQVYSIDQLKDGSLRIMLQQRDARTNA